MDLRILMLEDSREDAELIERVLQKSDFVFFSERVDTREKFIQMLEQFQPTLILSDHSLPGFNSIEALKICQERRSFIPFILVTGALSDEFAIRCLKLGADDYLLKSNLSRLPSSITSAFEQRRLQAAQRDYEEMLKTKNKALTKANEELDNFMYSVSHNLRQPLTSVMGLISLTKIGSTSNVNHELRLLLEKMEQSVGKLDNTLRDILDYSRNGRTEITIEKVDVGKILDECFERLRYVNGFARITRKIEIVQSTDCFSDPYRLSVIFTNILSNSIRYQDITKSRNTINIRVTVTDSENIIFISDNGVGIENEYLPKVFNMFYRATTHSDGAGIGLYIVKEIIDKLDGSIVLESIAGEGTMVMITLPNRSSTSENDANQKLELKSSGADKY